MLDVLASFPRARFLLVGDAGEQDLELYAALARERPAQVLAVFIRDVTPYGEGEVGIQDPTGEAAREPGAVAQALAMGALGVFNTALAYYVYFRLVNEEGPTFASLNNYIVPVIGVVGGAVALAEPIAPSAWAGLALVLCGVALTGRSLGRANAPRTGLPASRTRAN